MWSWTTTFALFCVAGLTQAQTPPGVFPQVPNFLAINYNGRFVNSGDTVGLDIANGTPQVGLPNNQGSNGQKYLLLMVDLDYNQNFKRQQPVPAPPQASAIGEIPADQPQDPEHANGASTFLQALVQDFQFTGQPLGDGAVLLGQNGNGPAPYIQPNPNMGTGHRYMMLVFNQPNGWALPPQLQEPVSRRTTFDLKNFVRQTGLGVPQFGNFFIVNNGGPGNGGNGNNGNSGSSGGIVTKTTTTTLANGGPTIVYPTTVSNTNGGSSPTPSTSTSTSTSTFLTTTTFPNGGPTQTFLTTTMVTFGNGNGSGSSSKTKTNNNDCSNNSGSNNCISGVSTYYTTGFIGFTVLTSATVSVFSTTSLNSNGQLTAFRTSSTSTVTRAFSGVSHISLSTYQTQATSTTTGTGFVNGQFTTYTSTTTSFGTTTSAASADSAAQTPAPNRLLGGGAAAFAVAAGALAVL